MRASRWQIFWRVQLPLLKPAIVIAVVIRTMEALKLFDQTVLLTCGGLAIPRRQSPSFCGGRSGSSTSFDSRESFCVPCSNRRRTPTLTHTTCCGRRVNFIISSLVEETDLWPLEVYPDFDLLETLSFFFQIDLGLR